VNYVLRQLMFTRRNFAALLQQAFPGSEWAPTIAPDRAPGPDSSHPGPFETTEPLGRSLALIGGAKYDEKALGRFLRSLPPDTIIVTGDGRGSEKRCREIATELGLRVDVPALSKPLYGSKALEVQVSQVLCSTAGRIVLVGSGGRVTKAREWLKRIQSQREVVEV
jgi:hypothetical protein